MKTANAFVVTMACMAMFCFASQPSFGALAAYYTFDGDNAADGSGHGNNGAVGSGVVFSNDAPAAIGGGRSADFPGSGGGSDGLVDVVNSASLQALKDTLTAEFFVKWDALNDGSDNWQRVMRKGSEGNPSSGWIINRNNNGNDLLMRTDTQGPGGAFNQNRGGGVGGGVLDGQWHHYAHVRDNGTWIEYLDGAQVGSGSYSHGTGFSNTQPLLIGGRPGDSFTGLLDNVAIHNRRLHPTEVAAIAAGDITPDGLVDAISINTGANPNWQVTGGDEFIPIGHFSLPTYDIDEVAGDAGNFDIEIKVTGIPLGGSAVIAFDKDVLNGTGVSWTNFHMTLGSGLDDQFVESDEFDFMFFNNDPPPVDKSGFFGSIMFDEIAAPDNLWYTGLLAPGQESNFWLSITVPDSIDGVTDGMATFTLRQIASPIPEPATATLAALGLGGLLMRRRRVA